MYIPGLAPSTLTNNVSLEDLVQEQQVEQSQSDHLGIGKTCLPPIFP